MMSFEEFKNTIKNEVLLRLPEEYDGSDVEFDVVKNAGYEYFALIIHPAGKGVNIAPALNISQAFDKYLDGMSIDAIADGLAKIRMNASIGNFKKKELLDFDCAKKKLYPRLINTASNEEYLSDKPHKTVEDLSIVYAVHVFEDEHGLGAAVVTNDLMDTWHTDIDTIHEVAMKNNDDTPYLFATISSLVFGNKSEVNVAIEDIELSDSDVPFFVLTNEHKTKGAVLALNEKLMSRIVDRFGDVYIIPSSVNETLIVPKKEVDDLDRIVEMLRSINAEEVKPEDQLSDNVYEWTVENGFKLA